MKLEQRKWDRIHGWTPKHPKTEMKTAQLILMFGARPFLKEQNLLQQINDSYPQEHIFGCSTAGEIHDAQVFDVSMVTTAIKFVHTQIMEVQLHLNPVDNNYQAKETLAVIKLYGSLLKIDFNSLGGWDSFGPERLVTNSKENVLYEFDGCSALERYKKYLGEKCKRSSRCMSVLPFTYSKYVRR